MKWFLSTEAYQEALKRRAAISGGIICICMLPRYVQAQRSCGGQLTEPIVGVVQDVTSALVPGAEIVLDGHRKTTSNPSGRFSFQCVSGGSHTLAVMAQGFSGTEVTVRSRERSDIRVTLQVQTVETDVVVAANEQSVDDDNATGASTLLSGTRLQALSDDSDDLLRELQQFGALTGGNLRGVNIAVDGFQGSSTLPPKSAIAYINVNPDLFSAEYRQPPFGGGSVEVYTKPGQSTYHGALFTTNSSPWENAKDPYSLSQGAIGKQREGFELTGPFLRPGTDFVTDLEHRAIDDVAVVNAVTLNAAGAEVSTLTNVPTPQDLWIGDLRVNTQIGAFNTFSMLYSANVNGQRNVGVGGTSLEETGYNSENYEHMLRFIDVTTAGSDVVNEARLSFRWDGETDHTTSSAPQIQVAGAFTGGGATIGSQELRELNTELDDDTIITTRNNLIKVGIQLSSFSEHQQLPTNFNGTYVFGGGTAPVLDGHNQPLPGQSEPISGLEQYRRALLNQPGGAPTAYSNVTGTPIVTFTQIQTAFFIQDDWKLRHGVNISSGLRYFVQNDPTLVSAITPRVGIVWNTGSNHSWSIHGHMGLFSSYLGENIEAQVLREDGTRRVTTTIYSPVYGDPPSGGTAIHSLRTYSPNLANVSMAIENLGFAHSIAGRWSVSGDYYFSRIWNYARSQNVNAPLNGIPAGPRREGIPNTNVLEVQPSGQGRANIEFIQLEQHASKHLQLFLGGSHIGLVDDTDDDPLSTPESSFSNVGEFAHRSNQPVWQVFGNASLTLPGAIVLSSNLNAGGNRHYNITTGLDNNGDGNFNDRPQYATVGMPGAVPTRYGLLVASGGMGTVPRNTGVYPWTVYLDANLQHSFKLTKLSGTRHEQVLTLNLRSSNAVNHTNVTAIGDVLGSPLFGSPYAADPGRRVEVGARYSF